jgi:hypothetical protein
LMADRSHGPRLSLARCYDDAMVARISG